MSSNLYLTYLALLEGRYTIEELARRRELKKNTAFAHIRALRRLGLVKPIRVYEGFGKRKPFRYVASKKASRKEFLALASRFSKRRRHPSLNAELLTIAKICAGLLRLYFGSMIEKIYLIGSAARRRAREESDIDLLVVVHDESGNPFDLTSLFVEAIYDVELAAGRYVEPIVVTESEIRTNEKWHPFYKSALANGVEL